jgi:bacillithiol system protein YtxJ
MEPMTPAISASTFAALQSPEHFQSLVEASHRAPVVIFKHSRACGTSHMAYEELEAFAGGEGAAEVYLVDVLFNRALSRAIAGRFAVRHESPQALVLAGGEVRWHGSHYRVTAEAVRQAVAATRTPRQDRSS